MLRTVSETCAGYVTSSSDVLVGRVGSKQWNEDKEGISAFESSVREEEEEEGPTTKFTENVI